MVALDPQLTVLAAQFLISLLSIPSPVGAVVVRSTHSSHHETPHRHQRPRPPVIPSPHSGHGSQLLQESRGPHVVEGVPDYNPHKHHQRSNEEASDLLVHLLTSLSGYNGMMGVPVVNPRVHRGQAHEQRVLQSRQLPQVLDALKGELGGVLQDAISVLGKILGLLAPPPVRRGHHDHYIQEEYYETFTEEERYHGHSKDDYHVHVHREASPDAERRNGTCAESGVQGFVAIQSNSRNVGHLELDMSNTTYVLKASANNRTLMEMLDCSSSSVPDQGTLCIPVKLMLQIFDPSHANYVEYCATYDPDPPSPKPLEVLPCTEASSDHSKQVFCYNSSTNAIYPIRITGDKNETEATTDDPAQGNRTSTQADSNSTSQNVTLVFEPNAPAAPTSSTVTTVTVTKTVTESDPSMNAAAEATTTASPSQTMTDSTSAATSSPTQPAAGMLNVEMANPSSLPASVPSAMSSSTPSLPSMTPPTDPRSTPPLPTRDPESVAAVIVSEMSDSTSASTTSTSTNSQPSESSGA
ncbi:hypothetical protein AMATHDRAFT_3451 [Amanita thiersii Skay4041]|uniref:Uncharacterized protein n=1 Tax=Amanita thiersii Skay4041 TaxID=703135 RepID=A0A2A9NTE7_9AGAR|nr:hypothetical protein AMATHDRAFT_3451 [Amanita thiersii Skay4041]